jgi:hypothetical protein
MDCVTAITADNKKGLAVSLLINKQQHDSQNGNTAIRQIL